MKKCYAYARVATANQISSERIKMIERSKDEYISGSRIELVEMKDPYSPVPAGTKGAVSFVDDSGSIHMKWDNGSTLALIPGEDLFRKI